MGANYVLLVAKNSKFSADKLRFDKTDPHVFLLIYCKLKTDFIAKCQLLYMGCLLKRAQTKKKYNFHFQNCMRPLMRECPLMEMCKYRV